MYMSLNAIGTVYAVALPIYATQTLHGGATDYTTDCRLCHVPAKKDDWVYIRGYPVLKK